jgi:hypothetical protein
MRGVALPEAAVRARVGREERLGRMVMPAQRLFVHHGPEQPEPAGHDAHSPGFANFDANRSLTLTAQLHVAPPAVSCEH